MLARLKQRLGSTADESAKTPDEATAVAGLLVECACADGVFSPEERHTVETVLGRRYGAEAACDAMKAAELRRETASSVHREVQDIKATIPHKERIALVEDLWEVIYSDGVRDAHEDSLVRRLLPLLGLEDKESGAARQRVVARRGD